MLNLSKKSLLLYAFYVFLALFLSPLVLNAQIIISEIMYDPEGADSGREWIEIYNSSAETVNLSNYKLLENNINHRLTEYENDGFLLEANKYAIIADNPAKFLVDFPTKLGLLIDSAFSLNNTGEEISIIDPDGQNIDSVNYLPEEWGAKGTGNSLQLHNSNWIPADPTPWQTNKTEAENESADSGDNSSDSSNSGSNSSGSSNSDSNSANSGSTHSSVDELSSYKPKIDLKISAGRNRNTIINSPIEFILQHNQDSNLKIKAEWSMGDGVLLKGSKITHHYLSSGVYNVVLNVSGKNGDKVETATTRTKVVVNEPEISMDFEVWGNVVDIILKNNASKEINLGKFYLKLADKKFRIAPDTIIDPKQTLYLSHRITKFDFSDYSGDWLKGQEINLYYPNGDKFLTQTALFSETTSQYDWIYQFVDPDKVPELKLILEKMN